MRACSGRGRDEIDRQADVRLDGGHAVLDIALHLGHADAHFLLEQFADKTDAARAEVVDVVFDCVRIIVQFDDMGDDCNQVARVDGLPLHLAFFHRFIEALVKAETADPRQVITIGLENIADELSGILGSGEVAVAQALVYFYERFICSLWRGLLKGSIR